MGNLMVERDEILAKARAIIDANPGGLSGEQAEEAAHYMDQVDCLDSQIKAARDSAAVMERVKGAAAVERSAAGSGAPARSLGDHFVKSFSGNEYVRHSGFSFAAPEFKNADDPFTMPQPSASPVVGDFFTQQLPTVQPYLPKLTIAALLGSMATDSDHIAYMVEKVDAVAEGKPATVAETGQRPFVRFDLFERVDENLREIAGMTKISETTINNAPYIRDIINNRLVRELQLVEEHQLLNGDGSGTNLTGLLNREGVQSQDISDAETTFNGLLEAKQKVVANTGYAADSLVVNPADYVKLVLKADKNGQYFAGGPFMGQYGNGGVLSGPQIWGMSVVDTPSIAAGSYMLGNFSQAGTVLRHGGLRVNSTNSNSTDFENGLITLRVSETVGLMVSRPACLVKGELAA